MIEACLRSLPAAFADAAEPSVVVVDNASTDGTVDVVARVAPDAHVVRRPANRGYAAAINAGVAAAPGGLGDALLILNPDIRLDAGSVGPLLAALGAPGVGIAVPMLVDEDGQLLRSLRRRPTVSRALAEALLGGDRAGRWGLGEVVGDPAAYQRPGPRRLGDRCGPGRLGGVLPRRSGHGTSRTSSTPRRSTSPSAPATPASACATSQRRGRCTWAASRAPTRGCGRCSPPTACGCTGDATGVCGVPRSEPWSLLNEAVRAALGSRDEPGRRPGPPRRSPGGSRTRARVGSRGPAAWSASRRRTGGTSTGPTPTSSSCARIARHRPVLLVNSLGMRMPLPGRSRQALGSHRAEAGQRRQGPAAPAARRSPASPCSPRCSCRCSGAGRAPRPQQSVRRVAGAPAPHDDSASTPRM